MSSPITGETVFDGSYIESEPPLTESMRSLSSLCRSMAFAQHGWWNQRGFNDWPINEVKPLEIRMRVAALVGDMLTPEGAELRVDNYYGRSLHLHPFKDSHLSRVSVGFRSIEVPQQRVVARRHAEELEGLDAIDVEPVDDDRILVTWKEARYSPQDWQGHIALSFWHQEGAEGQYYSSWDSPLELAERIELAGSESDRSAKPLIVAKVGTPKWGDGSGSEVYDLPGATPRMATDQEAMGLLTVVRQIIPKPWLRTDRP